MPKSMLCIILQGMANAKTATIIFKGEDQISPAIKGATASVGGLNTALTQTATQSGNAIRDKLVKELEAARIKLSEIAKQPKTAEIKIEQGRALAEVNRISRELKKLDQPITIKPKIEFDSLQLNAISQSFGAIAGKLTELRTAAVGAFGEIAAAERKLSTVSKESKQLIKNFGELAAANKFQATTAQLAGASYEVLSAGFTDTADVAKILEASTKGAVGGFSDVTTVSKATISALNAYGQSADQASAFVDKFVSVQQSGLITVDQYASQIARIAPTAAAAGVSLDELNGAIATATASGVPVEATFSGLRTALGAILKPSAEAVELSKELGIEFNATGLKTLGLSGILKQLKTTGNDSADTLLKLFGSAEALAAIAPSINSIEKLEANIKASADSAGLAATNFEKAVDPIKAFQNETTEALAILGRDIVKVFNPAVAGARQVVAAFRALPEPLQQIIAFVVGGGAAIAATGAAISGFLAVLTPTLAGLTALTTGLGAVNLTALVAKVNLALFSPVVLTAGASSATASIGVGALGTSLLALGTTAAAALVPLGLLVAAYKGFEFAKFANDLKGFNEELDIATAGSTAEGNAAFRLAERLRNVNEQRKQGKIINEQQRQGLLKLADEEIKVQQQSLARINALKPANDEQRASQAAQKAGIENTIKSLEKQKKALAENVAATKNQAATAKRSSEDIEAAAKKRLDAEKRSLEEGARLRARDFDAKAKTESGDFEKQARTEKQAFERSLNDEKRTFDNAQKADKDKFEKQLQVDQRQFNEGEKAKDAQFQKSKQDLERAFNAEQQAAKEAFDKKQQEATRAFDAKQNAEKVTADAQFAQRRLEIERKLQLEAAKPEDRAKLEAEFKAADEKVAREKEAFAQLKADEEAFAKKQQADKQAFEDAQKLAAQDFEKQQQAAKLAFDDQLKAKDLAFEQQKEAAKLAFEDTLKAKRDALEAGQNEAKLAFEDVIAAKRQAFEDAERAKKDAFDTAQNEKKAAFEDSERAKKQAFEDNLKTLEAQFKADERAKDLANAQQVAAIKNSGAANAVVGLASSVLGSARPLATGGRFSQGEQLLVGEKGAELVTFGSSGFVTNAANTKQILQSNTAPNSVSTARMEALLNQIASKLDRPSTNYQIQTSESPLDAALKLERENARMRALNSGI